MKSKRKFYKTVVTMIVLSEDAPVSEELHPGTIWHECQDGAWSGEAHITKIQELTSARMAKALVNQGSDPEFFGLDADGKEYTVDILPALKDGDS